MFGRAFRASGSYREHSADSRLSPIRLNLTVGSNDGHKWKRVRQGESVTITKQGRPVARLVPPVADDEERTRQAASRIRNRRRRLLGAPLAELVATVHEGHRH